MTVSYHRNRLRLLQKIFVAFSVAACTMLILSLTVPKLSSNLIAPQTKHMPVPYRDRNIENERTIRRKENEFSRHPAVFSWTNSSIVRWHKNKNCLSIFSLGASRLNMSDVTSEVLLYLRNLKKVKKKHQFLRQEAYSLLAEELPKVKPAEETKHGQLSSGIKGRLERMQGQLPYMPCRLRAYSAAQVAQCVASRRSNGKSTRALFIGDSRVRQFVEVFLDIFRDLNFLIATHEGLVVGIEEFLSVDADFLWTKYKREFNATSSDLPDLSVGFYWTSHMGVTLKAQLTEPQENPKLFRAAEKRLQERFRLQSSLINSSSAHANEFMNSPNKENNLNNYNIAAALSELIKAGDEVSGRSEETNKSSFNFAQFNESAPENYSKPLAFKSEPLELLTNISRLPEHQIPDIIILGTGIWGLDHHYDFFKVFDELSLTQVARLRPVMQVVARRTSVVWLMPPPISDNVFVVPYRRTLLSKMFNKYQEWITTAQMAAFHTAGIAVWDSFQPVAQASINDCVAHDKSAGELPRHPRLLYRQAWDCGDRVHTNNEAVVVGVQMVVNYLCNEYLHPQDYCCHRTT